MSNIDAPDVGSGETNIPDLLSEQSGIPNMSSTKTFVVDTNMQVNGDLDVTGTVTATSFIGDGSQLTGISGGSGGGLDSAAVTLLVDSDYVQARETPQDFAYSSLTGAPTALSSFTNDTSYITAADIPTTVDSDYVQARVTLDGVGLDSAGVTALVDSDYVAARAPAGETYSIDETGRNNTADWIQFIGSGVPSGQDQVFLKSRDTGNTWRGAAGQGGFQFDLLTPNQALVMEDGSTGVKLVGRHAETGGEEGLEIHGVGATVTNSTIRMITNNKTSVKVTDGSFELPSIPIADPVNTDEVWADNGVLVMSGFTAPAGGLDSAATIALIGMQNKPAGSNAIQITPDTSTLNGDNNNIIIGTQISDMAGIGPQAVAMGYDIGAQANGVSIGYQAGAGSQSTNTGGVFIGSRTNYFGNSNPADYAIAIGHEAGAVYPGVGSVALGKSAGAGSSGDYTVAIGYNANNTSNFNNTIMIKADGSAAYNSTAQYDIDIRTSAAGSLTYDTTNDWTFGAGVTMTDLTASGATVVFSNLPTTDPVNAGQLWNDAGTLKVSAG